jgi:hypothetical protein
MTKAIRLRRAIIATLILTATVTTLPLGQANASPIVGSKVTTSTTKRVCPVDWRKGRPYVKKLIRCAAHHYGVSADRAIYIARRESKFHPKAYNSWSCAKGIFQHLCKYWPSRAQTYGFDDWSAFNARANIMVTIRMVKRYGWGPWGY